MQLKEILGLGNDRGHIAGTEKRREKKIKNVI